MASSLPSVQKGGIRDLSSFPTYASVSRSRLKSLYSDFSLQKHSNPVGYQSNVDWWRRTLLHLLETARQPNSPDTLILHGETALLDGLRCTELGVGKPISLGSVLTELSASSIAIPLTAFQSASQSIYYPGSLPTRLAAYLIGKPLWWALEQLNVVSENYNEPEEKRWKRVRGDYVIVPLLERAADAIVEYYRSQSSLSLSDSLYDIGSFREKFASHALPDVTLSTSDIKVLVKYLERDRRVIVTAKDIIKFLDEKPDNAMVTQIDHGILELKLAVNRLHSQIEDIQHQIEDRTVKIIEQLKRKRKEMAMSYLRSRKQLEELLTKRLQSLETIQGALLQVESAAGNIEIMRAFETSAATLKSILSHPSLQRDKIDATMAALEEATANHAEIDETIRLGSEGVAAAAGTHIDEDEIEQEIQRMIEEKEREEDEEKKWQQLERVQRERKRKEKEEKEVREEQRLAEEYQREKEEQERINVLMESGRNTPVSTEHDKIWEEKWLTVEAEKAADAIRDRQEESRRRAEWKDEELERTQAA